MKLVLQLGLEKSAIFHFIQIANRGCHGCDRMVVGFTTTSAISA
jgi:hypothetical protein